MLGSSAGHTRIRMELAYSGDYDKVTKLPADLAYVQFWKVQNVLLGLCAPCREE